MLLEEKVQAYSEHWKLHKADITQAFSDAFGVDCSEMFNDLVCNISLNPYYPREQGGCIYPYFFTMVIEGVPITDTVREMYRTMKITEFMQESYAYCQRYETEIREHILCSENGGVDK